MSHGSTEGTVGLTTRRQCGHTFGPVSLKGRFADMAFRVSQFSLQKRSPTFRPCLTARWECRRNE